MKTASAISAKARGMSRAFAAMVLLLFIQLSGKLTLYLEPKRDVLNLYKQTKQARESKLQT